MPRITAAQFSYGSVTVVFSTLAMLLLSRTESGIGVAVIGTAALALGLLVAVTVPRPAPATAGKSARAGAAARPHRDAVRVAVETEGLALDELRTPAPDPSSAPHGKGRPVTARTEPVEDHRDERSLRH
ncbi:hypothetical protein ACFYXM_20705 [Streptomyces sp. NPDC002476]|uniref:hypothetical protein n=1 Tax=Streptomyces sp. NPDC002476 TaxID=3364648 RepID=UPI003674A7B8